MPFTNSLYTADKGRMSHAMRANRTRAFSDVCAFRHGSDHEAWETMQDCLLSQLHMLGKRSSS